MRRLFNLWRDQLRRGRRRGERADASIDRHPSGASLPERELIDKEDVQQALEAMDSLPSRQREVLYLRACEQLAPAEIAEILKISPEAVKAGLPLARKKRRPAACYNPVTPGEPVVW